MKLITNDQTYTGITFHVSPDGCVITAQTSVTVGDTLEIQTDTGSQLRTYTVADYLRCTVDGNTLTLSNTPLPEPVPVDLDALRTERITESKQALADWLQGHPLTWVDGKQYSVTDDKTTLMTKAIMMYQTKVASGVPAELKWNDTGEVCTVWTVENLTALAIAIDAYVAPLVSHQQTLEVEIRNAQTEDEIRSIVISYDA